MLRSARFLSALTALALMLVGCDSAPAPKPSPTAAPSSGSTTPTVPVAGGAVTITKADFAKLDAVIASHEGKLVVVDFWATWCPPCKAEFPNLVKLHQEWHSRGVECISVTLDDVEDRDKALDFLKAQKATFGNFLLDATPEQLKQKHDFDSIPTVLVYGRDGKLAKKFNTTSKETAYDYTDVRKFIEPLLK